MDVSISARHVTITPRLEEVIHEKIGQLDRYLDGLDYAGVHFDEAQNPRIADKEYCEVVLHGHGHRKLRTKLQRRQKGDGVTIRNGDVAPPASATASVGVIDDETAEEPFPQIVKTKRFHLGPLTPDEAVEKMEQLGHGFFFFINKDTHRSAVVYRRDDGDVGLIDEAG